jgi:hypothetical protein
MDGHTVASAGILQALKIERVVLFSVETGIAVVTALDDMAGYPCQIHTRFSGHGKVLF